MKIRFVKLESERPGIVKVRKQKRLKLSKWAEQASKERPAVKAKFGQLFEEVTAILFRHDPAHVNFGFNTDEYEPEVGTILPRLNECRSAQDVQKVVYEECGRWFAIPGDMEKYRLPSQEIWSALQRFKQAK